MRLLVGLLIGLITLTGCSTPIIESQPLTLVITTDSNILATWNVPMNKSVETNLPVKWTIFSQNLPKGITFTNGVIKGTPTELDSTGSITLTATRDAQTVTKTFNISVRDYVWTNYAEINVSNFVAGNRAEYTVQVHNDYSREKETIKVTTDNTDVPDQFGRITVPIPLSQKLGANDINNILGVTLASAKLIENGNLLYTTLEIKGYDQVKNAVIVNGFLALTEHIIVVEYSSDACFVMESECYIPQIAQMVTFEPKTFYLAPHATQEVLIIFEMPKEYNTTGLKEFNFQTSAGKTSAVDIGGNLQALYRLGCKWNVVMK